MANLRELEPWLYPWAAALLRVAAERGYRSVRVASVYRGGTLQGRLYRQYLSNRARDPSGEGTRYLPAAPPGQSFHQFRRAFDLNGDSHQIAALGKLWEQWGGRYGGPNLDPVHFEA